MYNIIKKVFQFTSSKAPEQLRYLFCDLIFIFDMRVISTDFHDITNILKYVCNYITIPKEVYLMQIAYTKKQTRNFKL